MMRLQRVGRKNDPSYRIVVTDKRTGPKSNKHIAILGSYNPKMSHIQLDVDAAKQWLSKGVQPSDTVHNILVGQKVIDAKKVNPLPRKSPIVDEEAIANKQKAEEEANAKAEADKAEADAPTVSDEASAEEPAEAGETAPEAVAEEPKEETPKEEASAEDDKKPEATA